MIGWLLLNALANNGKRNRRRRVRTRTTIAQSVSVSVYQSSYPHYVRIDSNWQ